ncbi:hypothetical protein [Clostridium oryzae]|uniref:Uncharacterized protein n=1 Tax=Clostridium oryzae TaxID=1450648 RepID=A0A1V4ILH8_9CLOT|nr:hypothetical protein [Clostridium oryzae]OPJ60605.1 hypothetical protein CLORY_27810 [Clostridium oryzae]
MDNNDKGRKNAEDRYDAPMSFDPDTFSSYLDSGSKIRPDDMKSTAISRKFHKRDKSLY